MDGAAPVASASVDLISFQVADRTLGMSLAAVGEVVRFGPISRIPLAPVAVVGAMNVRGRVLVVVDVAPLLGEPATVVRTGDLGLFVEADGVAAILAVGRVGQVVAVVDEGPGGDNALVRTVSGVDAAIELVDAEVLIRVVGAQIDAMAERVTGRARAIVGVTGVTG